MWHECSSVAVYHYDYDDDDDDNDYHYYYFNYLVCLRTAEKHSHSHFQRSLCSHFLIMLLERVNRNYLQCNMNIKILGCMIIHKLEYDCYSLMFSPLVVSWYSAKIADNLFIVHFVGQYLSLDTDHNGMLSKEELAR